MHIIRRLTIATVLASVAGPLTLTALVLDASQTREQYEQALQELQSGYREGASLEVTTDIAQKIVENTGQKLKSLDKRKRELRLEIAALIETMKMIDRRTGELANQQERSHNLLTEERGALSTFLRAAYVQHATDETGPLSNRLLVQRLLGQSLGESVDGDLRQSALTRARTRLMQRLLTTNEFASLSQEKLAAAAGEWAAKLTALQAEREKLLKESQTTQRTYDRAQRTLTVSDEEFAEIQRETQQVQEDILKMQSELARIDGRLKVKAERDLVQMGLRAPRPNRYKELPEGNQDFAWPVDGPLSAGFHDGPYQVHFRVPHQGIDIVVPQGTPVGSAAHGIVFIVRPGGPRGYTYVLIVHQDGYATLYGHLSEVSVKSGDEVVQGQIIGLSGATPGTPGAGPMTTGAHLHFEVIKNGVHLDPRSVLPK